MKKIFLVVISFALLIALLTTSVFAGAAFNDEKINGILDARLKNAGLSELQKLVSKSFSGTIESNDDWYVFSLRNLSSDINYAEYRKALEKYIKSNEISNAVTRQKLSLLLIAAGGDTSLIQNTVDETAGKLGCMSWVFALHLINNGAPSSGYTAQSLAEELLSLQLDDGGWAITGTSSNPDATAMVIQALTALRDDEKVNAAIDKALTALSSAQLENGCYLSYGNENPETCSQVLIALSGLGIDAASDERFVKNGKSILDAIDLFRLDDGTYSHTVGGTSSASATAQVLCALTAYDNINEKNFYLFGSLTEPELPSADTKTLLYIADAAICIIWAAACFIKGKRNIKNYIFIFIIFAAALLIISFVNISTKDSYYSKDDQTGKTVQTCISISCEVIQGEKSYIPEDGIILEKKEIIISEGKTAYDQLIAASKEYKIQTDSASGYISGIAGIYELDFGELSGWMYAVNGQFASVSCSEYILKEGDLVEWIYTKELGSDIGGGFNSGE